MFVSKIFALISDNHFADRAIEMKFFCDTVMHRSDRPGRERTSTADRGPVDLYYYDGLARQDHLVRLTVNCSEFYERPSRGDEGDLVPPLEHCIRTKWREANVDWNGSEKIL